MPLKLSARVAAVAGALIVAAAAGWIIWRQQRAPSGARSTEATYVGSQTCAECHQDQTTAWRESQHAAAMTEASERTVLGRFDGSEAGHSGTRSTFFRRDSRFYVRTDGPDGKAADFPVEYTFGVSPLQQYLIRLPGGRLQAFTVAWDARPASAGGQRWFDLYPREVLKAGDPLHWTGLQQNWNFMCADCHSTNVRKGYASDTRAFLTTWSEIAVGCEACHGPGSAHAALARSAAARGRSASGLTVRLDERRNIGWTIDATSGRPVRSQARSADREIEVCARCHSRRSQLTDAAKAGDALEDGFRPVLIEPALFHSDGQQHDEVYTYTSFLQSKMYAKGVTCADCHEPHSGKTRIAGNPLCTQCHQAVRYDAPAHHFHEPGTAGAACTACHMSTSTYMAIDPRHDHSFRVPRPDWTMKIGVPNSCTSACHATRTADWAVREIQRRSGRAPDSDRQFAEVFAAADRGAPGIAGRLRQLVVDRAQSAVVRASALERLAVTVAGPGDAASSGLRDSHPMVRRAALAALAHADPETRLRLAPPLLADPVRTVRTQAAVSLADVADRFLSGNARIDFDRAFGEFVVEQQFNADRPEAQMTLGTVWLASGRTEPAVSAFQEAIRLDRTFVPAYVNLADAFQSQGNETGAERTLRDGLRVAPATAALHHALGLSLVRQRRVPEAMEELSQAVRLEPATPRFSYTYGVALHDTGKVPAALEVLRASARKSPDDRDTLLVLAAYAEEAGRAAEARGYVARLLSLDPNDEEARALAARLR